MSASSRPLHLHSRLALVVLLLAGPAYADQLVYTPFAQPCRLLDTRASSGGLGPLIAPHGPYLLGTTSVDISSAFQHGNPTGCGIPAGISAVSVSMNMLDATTSGNIATWSADAGATAPNIGTGVYNASNTFNTGYATIPVGAAAGSNPGRFYLSVANGQIDMTINVVGYWSLQGPVSLPFATTINNAAPAFAITNSGGDGLNGFTSQANNSGVYGKNTGGGKGVFGASGTGNGVEGQSTSGSGLKGATAGTSGQFGAAGVWGDSHNFFGVWGTSVSGDGVHGNSQSSSGVFGASNTGVGVWGDTQTYDGVQGHTHNPNGSTSGVAGFGDGSNNGVAGISTNGNGVWGVTSTGNGVFGHSDSGYGMATDGHARQAIGMGGWLKAAVTYNQRNGGISQCFNSQIGGSQATSGTCGITVGNPQSGEIDVDWGFDATKGFVLALPGAAYSVRCFSTLGFADVNSGITRVGGGTLTVVGVYDSSGDATSDCSITIMLF